MAKHVVRVIGAVTMAPTEAKARSNARFKFMRVAYIKDIFMTMCIFIKANVR